ncbi:MAG: AraC family transcriptional regulator, partial [Clostridiales bacterium]|nr:AraC family transcriptional regulator [Clostridiales bacterium]
IDLGITTLETDKFISYINDFITETLLYTNSVNTKFDIEAIIKYIDDNFTSDIYLDQLAEQFGTSPKYLSRIIKNYLGMGFGQYVASLRIGKAKHMLTRTNSNINDIVIATGFNSHNTFIRTFKKLEGIVPSEYRNIFSNGKEKR